MKQIKKCDVCGNDVVIEQYKDKICKKCGWMLYPEGKLKNTTPFAGWIK